MQKAIATFNIPKYLKNNGIVLMVNNVREKSWIVNRTGESKVRTFAESGADCFDGNDERYPMCYASLDGFSLFCGTESAAYRLGRENYSIIGVDGLKAIMETIKSYA